MVENSKTNKGFSIPILIVGICLAILFAASNTYAGLKSGLTVAAGIPGTIIGAGFVSTFARKKGIYGINVIQAMSSGGEITTTSVFIIPAIIIVGASSFNPLEAFIVCLSGAILGAGVMFLLHNYLIATKHDDMHFPEATAIAESMQATTSGGEHLKLMGVGTLFAGVITTMTSQVLGLFESVFSVTGPAFYRFRLKIDANPMLLGLGFIIGLEVTLPMIASSLFGNFALMPLISYFSTMADHTTPVWNNLSKLIFALTNDELGSAYLRYIGAGMMIYGGIIGAAKLVPVVINSLKATIKDLKNKSSVDKSKGESESIQTILLVVGILSIIILAFVVCRFDILTSIICGIVAIIITILFSIVASRLTGSVGSSNMPASGLFIATTVLIFMVLFILGKATSENNITLLFLVTMVCGGIIYSAGYSQSSKASWFIGGNKYEIQKMFSIAFIVGMVVMVLATWILVPEIVGQNGISHFQAPQANLIATLTQGILSGALPWSMILIGLILGLVMHLLGVPIMLAALGLYLPIETVAIMFLGAIIRFLLVDLPQRRHPDDKKLQTKLEQRGSFGVAYSSGLVAGGSIFGLAGIMLQVTGILPSVSDNLFGGNYSAIILISIMIIFTYLPIRFWKSKEAIKN
ncbi:MAG: OPT/YSL family transporter [Bifidobacteriaceae bacterium]|jgi:putative OPT family oligopeptide transporter|nr:OPT/YSL family transporter [Bifidobacteriaceae bacterium]